MTIQTEILLSALTSYLVLIDPLGTALIFNALTTGREQAWRRTMAIRAVLLSIAVCLFFGFFGASLLGELGIAIESFRIAGGLLLFYTAFNMVTQPEGSTPGRPGGEQDDISVYPLTFPLMAGPGCLTLTILLFSNARTHEHGLLWVVAALLFNFLLTLVALILAAPLSRLIGKTGNSVIKRLLGVLLASLSIQFIVDGIRGFIE